MYILTSTKILKKPKAGPFFKTCISHVFLMYFKRLKTLSLKIHEKYMRNTYHIKIPFFKYMRNTLIWNSCLVKIHEKYMRYT